MKRSTIMMLLVLFTMSVPILAQQNDKELANVYLNLKGEVIFDFVVISKSELSSVTKEISIVHYDQATRTVKAMANATQFSNFLNKQIPFRVYPEDNITGERTMTSDLAVKAATFPLTAYPTYDDYVSMMNDFATNNPTLCKLENIGATTEGDKDILFVKLSDNVNSNEQEPRVMYTSTMHGDEIAGYPMMLNLIDLLLTAYQDTSHPRHAEIKNLLDNSEVWINPLANPDGTYRNSPNNTSIANATRGNANNVDLNRNYPDPDDGANPDGNAYQTETLAFMNFADTKHFVLSANFHGGIELINYPWDTFAGAHPDEDYFIHISEEYRDFCQANSPAGYFDALNNGITNGYDWYEVEGGRQDYQIYFKKGREVTVELSNDKTPPASQLVNFWNYNVDALIAFLKQVNYGIRGVVTDAVTNEPIEAKVTVVGKENFETWVPTELPEGDYYRPIKAGTYSLVFEAECYESLTITGVTIADYATVVQDIQLTPIGGITPTGLSASNVQASTATLNWNDSSGATYDIRYREIGNANWIVAPIGTNTFTITGLSANTSYEAQVRSKCAGGASSSYSDSVNFTTTDIPACAGINSFPYTESFESGFGSWTNASGDDIEWTRDSGGTPSQTTGPSTGQQGAFYLFTEASRSANGSPSKTAILDSPCIDLSALSGASLEFGYHMYGATMGSMELLISTDDGANYTSIWSQNGDLGDVWNQASLDLSAYTGGVIKLQFKGITGSSWRSDMAIDNITIFSSTPDTEAPTAPTNVVSSNITSAGVTLSWEASADNIGVTSYEIYQDSSLLTTVSGLVYVVSGLNPNTSYSFSVRAKDAAGNESPSSNVVSVTTAEGDITYCSSQGNNVNFEYIDFVGLTGINNATSANGGYADFTSLVADIPYGANTITLSVGFASTSYTEFWGVWIDYNKNGTFESSEQIVSESTTNSANQSYNFTVPSSALSGNTRMRVSMKYNAAPSPCENFTYGEVEDYTINIGGVVSAKEQDVVDANISEALRIYPNPLKEGKLFIKGLQKEIQDYKILNYSGQIVMKGKIVTDNIDVSNLSNGLYLLELYHDDKKWSHKFMKR